MAMICMFIGRDVVRVFSFFLPFFSFFAVFFFFFCRNGQVCYKIRRVIIGQSLGASLGDDWAWCMGGYFTLGTCAGSGVYLRAWW